jgi:prephenate dehydrogenase
MTGVATHPWSVGIVGCGLIGGSIGRALAGRVQQRIAIELPEWPVNPEIVGSIVDDVMPVSCALSHVNVVILALPVDMIVHFIDTYAQAIASGALVMDVGSVKRSVVAAYDRVGRSDIDLIGGHPICGSEQSGHEAARGDLFVDAAWVIVPSAEAQPAAIERAAQFVRLLGAHPVQLDADSHDRFVACTSHLVRLCGGVLAQTVVSYEQGASHVSELVGGGLRHATRLARGDTAMWASIFAANADYVASVARALAAQLDDAIAALESADPAVIEAWVHASRTAAATLQ